MPEYVGSGQGYQGRESFDNISHNWLLDNIPMDKAVLGKWLKAGYVERRELFPTEAGTPQGGVMTPPTKEQNC